MHLTPTTPSPALAALVAEYWEAFVAFEPIFATSIGDRRFDDRLTDRGPEAIAAQRGRLASILARVQEIDAPALSVADRVTRSALIEQLDSDLVGLNAGLRGVDGGPARWPPRRRP